ncbi:unnamed protein product, partial [marine sediment metagenome]
MSYKNICDFCSEEINILDKYVEIGKLEKEKGFSA